MYVLGALLFGIATFRARILPRWAAVLLALGALLRSPSVAVVPHQFERVVCSDADGDSSGLAGICALV